MKSLMSCCVLPTSDSFASYVRKPVCCRQGLHLLVEGVGGDDQVIRLGC
jgi:hypothetical protein